MLREVGELYGCLVAVTRSIKSLVISQLESRSQLHSDRRNINLRLARGPRLQMDVPRRARKLGTTTAVAGGAPHTTSPRSSRGELPASKRTAAHRRLLLRLFRASYKPTHRQKTHFCVCREMARISPCSWLPVKISVFRTPTAYIRQLSPLYAVQLRF